jgi:hypothetical protein
VNLEPLFTALAGRRCFVAWRPAPKPGTAKVDKIPIDPNTGRDSDAQDAATWLTAEEARGWAVAGVPVGIVISEGSGLFCVDLDAALGDDGQWSPLSLDVLQRFPGAVVEVSHSGRGLHIFGLCQPLPEHRTRQAGVALEIYTRRRFIALTGTHMTGTLSDHTAALVQLIADYLPEPIATRKAEWTTGPFVGWRGGGTDEQIIASQLNRASASATWGTGASFADLWHANSEALARAFPDTSGGKDYNASAADQALANHLAWATGYDCERVLRLMWGSKLRREKWERDDYMARTILAAVAGKIPTRAPDIDGATVPLQATAAPTAPGVPAGPAPVPPSPAVVTAGLGPSAAADVTAYVNADRPLLVIPPPPPRSTERGVLPAPGDYVASSKQPELFDGCIYIEDIHGMLMPDGNILAQKQFDVHFGGFDFQMHTDGAKPTTSAWDCFVGSQMIRFPRANGLCFDPREDTRAVVHRDGMTFINSWVPVTIPMAEGDAAPFLRHLKTLYPLGNDAEILLCYFAACMQYKGRKFQWAPLLQGVEGNGKTFFSIAMEHCVGQRYTHHAKAAQLDNRFNAAFYGKLLVTVEDVYISEARSSMWETLKPMITNTRMEIEGKGLDKVTRDVCFNFIMNSNHKDAIRKTRNDRRIAPFFGAQQHEADLARSGLTEAYFKQLYRWAEGGGYAIIANFLNTYPIPDKWNPAVDCVRAPDTSSTEAALHAGRGSIEQEVAEAVEEGRPGFRGGWIASTAFDNLLGELGKSKYLPRNKRRELLEGMGYAAHPQLPDGRVLTPLPDGTRPRLFTLPGVHADVNDPPELARLYLAAQVVPK